MSKNIVVIGKGGREHAIVWKLAQSKHVKKIFAIPGSYGIGQVEKTENVNIDLKDFKKIVEFCQINNVSLVAVGPEVPLADGITDHLENAGIAVFGPCQQPAQIETSKSWSKAFMDRHNIPTAQWKSFTNADEAKKFIKSADFPALVVKASGLASGKGVIVAKDQAEACQAVDEMLNQKKFGDAGAVVVVEELLEGDEMSLLAFTDGKTIKAMLPCQDHKRLGDNDEGLNTGGMGVYCPYPLSEESELDFIKQEMLEKCIKGFNKDNMKFKGVLYAGVILTPRGPKILEYNCRFGDPETEVLLPLLENDLYEVMEACTNGTLDKIELKWKTNVSAVGVVLAAPGYPETTIKGDEVTGISEVSQKKNHIVFHMSTTDDKGKVISGGGRVLIAVSLASNLAMAACQATHAIRDVIQLKGKQFRKDIAHKGIGRAILRKGNLTYQASGVSIEAGNDFVTQIKPAVKSTNRNGVMGQIGSFGGLFDVKATGYQDPILVSGTDGVGTKLKIAQEMNLHDTIGIDLVAMCVNDILAHGAEPLFFLDYFACGRLDVNVATKVVKGIAEGCRQAGCSLIGGETAEMPGMYAEDEYDLAGFTVGAVERKNMIPDTSISKGDQIIGLPSSGIHSNGYSLVRKIMQISNSKFQDPAPFSTTGKSFGEEFLTPTSIYVRALLPLLKQKKIKAFAHITGGGIVENVPRVMPSNLTAVLDAKSWNIPPVFAWLATAGSVNEMEMLRTFNCGLGGVVVVDSKVADAVLEVLKPHGGRVVGYVDNNNHGKNVEVHNFVDSMEAVMRPLMKPVFGNLKPKKRVGILISGTGSNMKSLYKSSEYLGYEVVLVISNNESAEGLKFTAAENIPSVVINHKNFGSREEFDEAVHQQLLKYQVDIVCLAGFMRLLSKDFVDKWYGRMLNIHPSLLPSFKGVRAQRQALEAGVRVSGCTVHFVDSTLDGGHIVMQQAVEIDPNETEEELIEKIKKAEHQIYPKALELLAREKIKIVNDKIVWSK